MLKRLFDIICSGIGLVMLSPLFLIVACLVRISSPGPVFFLQERMGKAFTPFSIYKFRSMTHGPRANGPQITAGNDKRITPVGRILRKTKIDELPQLINVFRGDMSLVGPRPEVRKYVELYRKEYEEILRVRPGITDIASITFRNEEGILQAQADPEKYYVEVLLPRKMELAMDYIADSSFFYDMALIFRTFSRIVGSSRDRA